MLCFDKKKTYQRWKHIAEYHRKSGVSENSKVYYGLILQMDFMGGIVILVKVGEMYSIMTSASHYLLVERWDENGWSKLFCWRYAHTFTMAFL